MAHLGWLGIAIPEEYGGAGQGMTDLCLFSRRPRTVWPPSAVSAPPSSPPPHTRSSAPRSRSAPYSKVWSPAGSRPSRCRNPAPAPTWAP
jgi:hypothetical protein